MSAARPPHAGRPRGVGNTAKAQGNAFEAALLVAHARYALEGRAAIVQCHQPTKSFGGAGGSARRTVLSGTGAPDFAGVVNARPFAEGSRFGTHPPLAVLFDAKTLDGAATYRHPADRLTQIKALREHARCGGRGFLLVLDRELRRLYRLEGAETLATLYGNGIEGGSVPLREERTRSPRSRVDNPIPRALQPHLLVPELDMLLGRVDWLPLLDVVGP